MTDQFKIIISTRTSRTIVRLHCAQGQYIKMNVLAACAALITVATGIVITV